MTDHVVSTEKYLHLVKVEELAKELIEWIILEDEIDSYDQMPEGKIKNLAIELKIFD